MVSTASDYKSLLKAAVISDCRPRQIVVKYFVRNHLLVPVLEDGLRADGPVMKGEVCEDGIIGIMRVRGIFSHSPFVEMV